MGKVWAVDPIVLNFLMELDSIDYCMGFGNVRFLHCCDTNNSNSWFLAKLIGFSEGLSLFKLIFSSENLNLNIHSVPGKFEQLKHIIQNKAHILVLTETKMNFSFLNQQFYFKEFCLPFQLDRKIHEGGVLIYVEEDIPSKALNKHILPEDVETVFIEMNLRKEKWLLCGTYQPQVKKMKLFLPYG